VDVEGLKIQAVKSPLTERAFPFRHSRAFVAAAGNFASVTTDS
jgi:hypothetical protein